MKKYDFIEIGTSDFDTLIESCSDDTIGLSIEPISYYLNKLPNKKNVKKICAAISNIDGYTDVFYIPEETIKNEKLKWWLRGSNSIGSPHPFAVEELGIEYYNSIVKIEKIKTISWKSLIEGEQIGYIGFLKIDTEGFDHIILEEYLELCELNPNLYADKIKFERHPKVSNISEIDKIISSIKKYNVKFDGTDVILEKIKIPKIIHQTFRTNELPLEIKKSVDLLKSMNSDYEYRFYNDEDCVKFIYENYDKETLDLYNSINPKYSSARADFFRYLLMYKIGGVYLDIKSCTTKPLRETILSTDEYLLTHWAGRDWNEVLNYYHGEFQNWHIICTPNHPFLAKTIEIVKDNIKNYTGEKGKLAVLNLTGPIAYSKAILSILDEHRKYTEDSAVREFKLENEINLIYVNTNIHHKYIYGNNVSNEEPIVINNLKHKNSFILYCTENYFDILVQSVRSIREYSEKPILVYLINSDKKIDITNVRTIRWELPDYEYEDSMHIKSDGNLYINRSNKNIYKILIQRIKVIEHALKNYTEVAAYVDTDSVATQYVDRIFDMYDIDSTYPYFVEGIYDFLHYNGKGGSENKNDLSTTLEAPACDLFNINQYVRERYRQTGYFVAGQNTFDFLKEWYWYCINPKIIENNEYYAPYHEETIVNVLLYKYNIQKGLPYLYVNGSLDIIDEVYNDIEFKGSNIQNHIREWLRIPENKETILFFHGEKNPKIMGEIIEKLKFYSKKNKKIKLLFLVPHLSTGGMPAYVLKKIETLQKYTNKFDIYVVEFSNYSDYYVVQKNKIIDLIPKDRFFRLGNVGSDKSNLINILKNNDIDILHADEILEGFDHFNKIPDNLLDQIYSKDRTWKIIETCHNVWFDYDNNKKYDPDAYAFCTPYHPTKQFINSPSYYEVFEFPIEDKTPSKELKEITINELGLNPNKLNILNVGLWTSGKNQGEGVEIARFLEKTNPNLHFHFIGNQAPNFEDYWRPIMDNLPSNVTVWGERDDVDKFMIASDLFMFNSTWECNPLVLREAVSYGMKIVSRNLPQYMDMFTKYINTLGSTIEENSKILLDTIYKDRTYEIPKLQEKEFASKLEVFYIKINSESISNTKNIKEKISITQHFVGSPFLEIKGDQNNKNEYLVKFFDEKDNIIYDKIINVNNWIKLNREYYTKWKTKIWENGNLIYDNILNFADKRIYISFDSSSLGDSIAWIPYCLEFKKKHNCHVVVSTFWNKLFKDVYPELEFVEPGTVVNNLHGMYKLGWFYNIDKEPELPNTIPLQKTAANILGLEFEEIIPEISFNIKERPLDDRYVTIATNSTAGLKFWQKEEWQKVINYLNDMNYKVINVSKEKNSFENTIQLNDISIENTINTIYHSNFFIGLSSGLSWLAWGLKKKVVMISNFTSSDHEFQTNCIRITNPNVCNSCWNNPNFRFDRGDWNWCPIWKNTDRQFECHKSITGEMVIEKLKNLI